MFNYLRIVVQELRKIYHVKVFLVKKYPQHQLNSIISEKILFKCNHLVIEKDVIISNENLVIGRHTYIGNNTFIDSCDKIGAFCSISSGVKIGMRNHPLDHISTSPMFYSAYRSWLSESTFNDADNKAVRIEDDVLISANAVIINGVKISTGAVIAAGAVVTKDVPPYAIVAGVPAKVIKYRFSEKEIEKLLKSEWWNKEDDELKQIMHLSNTPKEFLDKLK